MFIYVIASTASFVGPSNHHSLLQFNDSAVTCVVVGPSFSFKSSSLGSNHAVMEVVKLLEIFLYIIASTASFVASSNYHSLLQFIDSAGTCVAVGPSFSFKSKSLGSNHAVMAVVKYCLTCLYMS